MKGKKKKKSRGMKQQILEEKKREQRIGLAVAVAILIIIVSVSGFFVHSMLSSPIQKQESSSTSEPRAAIVDHLSLTAPNQTFIQTATNILQKTGYTVDYYPSEEITVEFYRNLPTKGYNFIFLRVHSGCNPTVFLFTSEAYSTTKYPYEQLTERIGQVGFVENGSTYFGVNSEFVKSSMRGRFDKTVIIMMGCAGIADFSMADAFINKGAKVYISWDKPVLASHTDLAISHLLQHFLIQKLTLKESLQETIKEVGLDPTYESILLYYPLEAGGYTIQNACASTD